MTENLIQLSKIQCPYCWQLIEVIIEDCGEDQQYIEDCQVCCRPINFHIELDAAAQLQVHVYSDNE